MPPKKGKKGKGKGGDDKPKGPKGPKLKAVPEGLHTSDMTKGQLMSFIKRLLAEQEQEILEKNLFLLEKSKLYEFWTLCMDKVKVLKDEMLTKSIEQDKRQGDKASEKEYQDHKLRHLQNEEMKNCGKIRLQHLKYMKKKSDEIWGVENVLREAALHKRMQLRTQTRSQFEILRSLYTKHAKTLQEMMLSFTKTLRDKEVVWQRHFDDRKERAVTGLTSKDSAIHALRMETLDQMNDIHEKSVQDLQTFFNDMTTNNLAVIGSMENDLDELKNTNNRLNRDLQNAKLHYQKVKAPLEAMQTGLIDWGDESKKLDLLHRQDTKLREELSTKTTYEKNMKILTEILLEQVELAENDYVQVMSQFGKSVKEIQKNVGMNNFVQQLKFKAAQKDIVILSALTQASITKDCRPLQGFQDDISALQDKVRKRLEEKTAHRACSRVSDINSAVREYGSGLRNKEKTILPPVIKSDKNAGFNLQYTGRGQAIASNIHYRGSELGERLKSTTPSVRDLGYGFYYIQPGHLHKANVLQSASSQKLPQLLKNSSKERYDTAPRSIINVDKLVSTASKLPSIKISRTSIPGSKASVKGPTPTSILKQSKDMQSVRKSIPVEE